MAKIYSKEWNGTLIEVKNEPKRAELVINGRTVDFIEGGKLVEGENDYMHSYDGENHIEVRFDERNFILFSGIFIKLSYNGREIERVPFK